MQGRSKGRPELASRIALPRLHDRLPRDWSAPLVRGQGLSRRLKLALGLLTVIVFTVLVARQVVPYDPLTINPSQRLLAPSQEHLFGTDMFGRDLFSRILYGAQPTFQVAFGAVVVGSVPGVLLGLLAGSKRGWFDQLLTQVIDAWIALPGILVALVMIAAFGRSLLILTVALGISSIPMFYRVVRAETMRVSAEPYVEAAVSLGAQQREILISHIFPNILPSLIALLTISIGRMLLATSALSFVGLGVPPPSPEWGGLLAEGRDHLESSWWLLWFPGTALAFTTFTFFLLGNALRDHQS